ncbi:MAG: nucleotidyltransferase family protein [Limisphaerales bacterium]
MSQAPAPFGVAILGAGASSRMGRPKLLLPWNTTTVIGHIIGQWRQLGAAQIAIVQRKDDTALKTELDRLKLPVLDQIENPHPEGEMFSSVVCAAHWNGWRADLKSVAIALGDQPQLRRETLQGLMQCRHERPDAVCQPAFEGRARHPVLLPWAVFHDLRSASAKTLKDFLKQIRCPRVQYAVNDWTLSLDLDTPEDYIRATTYYTS